VTTRLAWPVCHRPAGDYDAVADAVCSGRPFRQPLRLPDAAGFVDGMELWLQAGTEAVSLTACFRGYVVFQPAAGEQPASLRLNLQREVRDELRRLNTLEALPNAIIYFNVDRAAVRQALVTLITSAYDAATGPRNSWHPSMRDVRWRGGRLKERLDATREADRSASINAVVENCLANSGTDPNARLPVLAGDNIGEAATAFGGAAPPPTCPFAADTTPPRQLIVKLEERCGQVRNLLYDLWAWLNDAGNARPHIELLAPHNAGTANAHPIIRVTLLALATPKPAPRMETAAPLRPIPMEDIGDFHSRDDARVEWRLTDEGILESRLRAGQPGPEPELGPGAYGELVRRMWGINQPEAGYANHIVDMSQRLQVPCELIMAFLGRETGNLNTRAVRFERAGTIDPADEPTDDPVYRDLAARYRDLVPNNGVSTNVPDPWDGAEVFRAAGGVQLTWADIAALLDLSPHFRGRISPGLMQTVIGTAISTLDWLEGVFPEIQETYLDSRGQQPNWWSYFGVVNRPATPSEYLTSWLLVPRQSILAGTAYIRKEYNQDAEGTCWDPPKVAAAYNAGRVRNPLLPRNLTPAERNLQRTWGMHYAPDYMSRFGQVYNAAVAFLDSDELVPPAPPVRVRR
jgi:hypothetical protein